MPSRPSSTLLPPLLALALLGAQAGPSRATDVAWQVRILSADLTTREVDRAELLLDVGGDPVDRRIAIRQGAFLAHATGLPVGRTRDEGGTTIVAALGEPFTVETDAPGFELDVDARADAETNGRLVAELTLRLGPLTKRVRSVPLSTHRARLWVVPGWSEVHAVVLEAWPTGSPPEVTRPEGTARVELSLVRGDWRAGAGPEDLGESDFPTWVDPFELAPGESAADLLRPVSAGVAGAGTVVARQTLELPLGELMTFEKGRRPGSGAERPGEFVGATVVVRPAPGEGGGAPAAAAPSLLVNLSLQTSHLGAPALVRMRRMSVQPGGTQAWLVPTDDHVHVLFLRVTPGRPGLAQPVRPAAERP